MIQRPCAMPKVDSTRRPARPSSSRPNFKTSRTRGLPRVAVETSAPNYYAVLQVHPDAEDEVIEAAYRQLMKKYHPDLAGDDPRRIALHNHRAKTINQAFSVLRDPEKRRLYDSAHWATNTSPSPGRARSTATNGASATAGV